MKRKKALFAAFLCLAAAVLLPAGGQKESASKLYLGLAAPLTGDSAMYGETVRGGVMFAVAQGKKFEAIVQDDKGDPKEAALVANSDYGLGLLKSARAAAAKYSLEIVASETYVPLVDKDFSPQLAKIKAANPDAMPILGDYNEAGLIIRQMKTLGLNIDRITPAACSRPVMINLVGAAAARGDVNGLRDVALLAPEHSDRQGA